MQWNRPSKRADRKQFTRRMALRRAGIVTATVALAPALQACGTDDNDETALVPDDGTPPGSIPTLAPLATPPVIEEPEPTTAPTAPVGEATAPAEQSAAPAKETGGSMIEMNDQLQFDPEQLTLRVGETVTWRTVGVTSHTSTCDPAEAQSPEEHVSLPEGAETWNSGLVNQDKEFAHMFEVPGEYTYFCIPHEAVGMVGYLTVEP